MRIRRLADIAEHGKDAEKAFVDDFLDAIAHENLVWRRTWREAQDLWERACKFFIDQEKPYPEVAAMFILTALTEAGKDIEGIRRHFE